MMNTELQNPQQPLVSVVIPTYNRAQYIAETIESVLAQTYKNMEIIVIDDGSTDNTREVVEPFTDRVRYIWQENAERGASRNHGLRLASGEFIAFLDSDDLWLPDKVEKDVEFMVGNPEVGVVYTNSVLVDADGRELRVLRAPRLSGRVTEKLLHKNFVSIGAHLARTSLVREIGGFREDRELSGSEDWEMWVRLSLHTNFAHNPVATVKIRTHPSNTMSDAQAMQRSMARAMHLLREDSGLSATQKQILDRAKARMALVNAINHCTQGKRRAGFDFLKEAFVQDPLVILDPRFAYTGLRLLKLRN